MHALVDEYSPNSVETMTMDNKQLVAVIWYHNRGGGRNKAFVGRPLLITDVGGCQNGRGETTTLRLCFVK